MSRRLFSRDPTFGVTKWWHYDADTDVATIETVQDVEPLLDRNASLQNNVTSLDRWGDGKIVASIPMSIYAEFLASGKINDQAFMRRWLNDRDNRKYRVRPGRV